MRARVRRSEMTRDGGDYEMYKQARQDTGTSWSDYRLFQIYRDDLIADYQSGRPVGDRGFALRALAVELGLPESAGNYHIPFGLTHPI